MLTPEDKEALYGLTKHPGYVVAKRIFKENQVEAIHIQMESDKTPEDIFFHQGEINGIKQVFVGIDAAVTRLKKEEEQKDGDREETTNE